MDVLLLRVKSCYASALVGMCNYVVTARSIA